MSFKPHKAKKIFSKLKIKESNSNHHIKGFLVYDGVRLFPPIFYSKGNKEIPLQIVEKFRKSLYLDKNAFSFLSSCKMTYEQYFAIRFEKTNGR